MKKVNVFISYAHEDADYKNELDRFMIMLKRNEQINLWQDNMIIAGQDWDPAIKKGLEEADIVIFLLSVDLLNSTYVWDTELATTLERRKKGECILLPIVIRDCPWRDSPFSAIQVLPRGAQAIAKSANKDQTYTEIVSEIKRVINSFD